MANHTPVEPDPEEVQRAQDLWTNFTKLSTYAVVATLIVLAVLTLVFIA